MIMMKSREYEITISPYDPLTYHDQSKRPLDFIDFIHVQRGQSWYTRQLQEKLFSKKTSIKTSWNSYYLITEALKM